MGYTLYTFKTSTKPKIRINRATFIIAGVTFLLSLLTIGGLKLPYIQEYIPKILLSYEPLIVCVILLFISLAYPLQKRSIDIEGINPTELKYSKAKYSSPVNLLPKIDRQADVTSGASICVSPKVTDNENKSLNQYSPNTNDYITPIKNLLSKDKIIVQETEDKFSLDFRKIPKIWPGRRFAKAKQHFTGQNDAYTMYNEYWAYDETCVSLKETQPVIIIESLPRIPVLPIPDLKWPQIMSATDYINANFVTTYLDIRDSDKVFNSISRSVFRKSSRKAVFEKPVLKRIKTIFKNPKDQELSEKTNVKQKNLDRNLRYVVAQLPKICKNPSLNRMVERFWLMIIQQELDVMVHLRENSVGDFYPEMGDKIDIKLNNKTGGGPAVCYQIKRLDDEHHIKQAPVNCKCMKFSVVDFVNSNNPKTFLVTIFQYTDWIDKSTNVLTKYHLYQNYKNGLPKDPKKFRDFICFINKTIRCSNDYMSDTLLVACADGVTSSGVFVLLESLLSQYDKAFAVSPKTILQQMRVQRCGLVKNNIHFLEVVKYLAEYIEYKSWMTLAPKTDLKHRPVNYDPLKRDDSMKSFSSLKNSVNMTKSLSLAGDFVTKSHSFDGPVTVKKSEQSPLSIPRKPIKLIFSGKKSIYDNSPINPFSNNVDFNFDSPSQSQNLAKTFRCDSAEIPDDDEDDSLKDLKFVPIYGLNHFNPPEKSSMPIELIIRGEKSGDKSKNSSEGFKKGHRVTGSLDRVELMNVSQHIGLDWRTKVGAVKEKEETDD